MSVGRVPGAEIAYEIDGPPDGPVVVLAHSLGASRDLWWRQVPALAEAFRVVRYDSRGHGDSAAPQGEYTAESLAADALALLDHLGIARVAFCGLSLGGVVGQWLAIHAPDRVECLALANTAPRLGTAEGWQERIDLVRAEGLAGVARSGPERWFTAGFRDADPEAVERVREVLLATPAHGYAGCCAALRDTDLRDSLAELRVPTLVIGGRHDPVTTARTTRDLAAAIPGARHVELEASHLANVERAEEFTGALRALLEAG